MKHIKQGLNVFLAGVMLTAGVAFAQQPPSPHATPPPAVTQQLVPPAVVPAVTTDTTLATPPAILPPADGAAPAVTATGELNPNDIAPLVFSYWEHAAINDARLSRGLVRPPTEEELMKDLKTKQEAKQKPTPEEREIKLGGIVYTTGADWTIWLNGKRVTPDAIPKEVIDLKVFKEYVEMKWFDDYTNQIFPLRLRPHERFNIDSRIFLPG